MNSITLTKTVETAIKAVTTIRADVGATICCTHVYNANLTKELYYNYVLSIDDFGGIEYRVEIDGSCVTVFQVVLNYNGLCEGFRALYSIDTANKGIAEVAAVIACWLTYLKK